MFASLQGIFHNVEPRNRGCAGSGGQIAGQHAQSRGLACAVRPQEPYDFPLFNLEGGILYRLKAAKLFGKLGRRGSWNQWEQGDSNPNRFRLKLILPYAEEALLPLEKPWAFNGAMLFPAWREGTKRREINPSALLPASGRCPSRAHPLPYGRQPACSHG